MKKIFISIILGSLVLSITACGSKKKDTKTTDTLVCDIKESARTIKNTLTFENNEVVKLDVDMRFDDADTAKAFYELIKSQGLNYGTLNGTIIKKELTGDKITKEIGSFKTKEEFRNYLEKKGYVCE